MRRLIVVCTFLIAACGENRQSVAMRDSEGNTRSLEVVDKGASRTVTSGDGLIRAEGSRGGDKARFPEFAPQYPGAKVQSAVDMAVGGSATGGVQQHIITQFTADTPDAVIAFYKDKVGTSGKRLQELKTGTGPMLVIGGRSIMDMDAAVTVMTVAGGTSVNVTVQERTARP